MKGVKLPTWVGWQFKSSTLTKLQPNAPMLEHAMDRGWQPLYTEAQMLAIHEQGRLAGLEEAVEAVAACRPEDANCAWESAYKHVADAHVDAIRALAAPGAGKETGHG